MLPDRWNVRVRLRNWLSRPTAPEMAAFKALEEEMGRVRASVCGYEASTTFVLDANNRVTTVTRMPPASSVGQAR